MTKINLSIEELYPVYEIREPRESYFESTVDVHPETLARWRRTIAAYQQVQDEMREVHDEAREAEDDGPGPFRPSYGTND